MFCSFYFKHLGSKFASVRPPSVTPIIVVVIVVIIVVIIIIIIIILFFTNVAVKLVALLHRLLF
jgi:hypothetical protein